MYLLKCYAIQRELFVGYKHIRLKSFTEKCFCSNITSNDVIKSRIKKLVELLDCTSLTAKMIILENKNILSISNKIFSQNIRFCSKHLKLSDIIEFPTIISLNSSLLEHRFYALMELGCSNITANIILRFPKVIKMSPNALQKNGIVFSKDYYMDQYIDSLNSEYKSDIKSRLQKMYKNDEKLCSIKKAMNAEFLSSKFNFSLFKVDQMFKKYPPLKIQSIQGTNQAIDVLLQTYKFSPSKIFSSPNLLSINHEEAKEFLVNMPTILGMSTIQVAKKLPAILLQSTDSLQKMDAILKDFNVSGNQLLCCPKILSFTPSVVQERMEALCSSHEFSLLKRYKKFLWLVYHYHKLEPRMETLKQYNIPYSINMFTTTEKQFNKYFCSYKSRSHIKDICAYLANALGSSDKEILLKLKEHPNFHSSSIYKCSKIIDFLLQAGVRKQQILNGVGIILYDTNLVESYFKEMQNDTECLPFSEWSNHFNLIQLLIYKIEKDTNFGGVTPLKVRSHNLNLLKARCC